MSQPQQFCVRWNSYHTNLQTVFPKLLTTENFVDVTLACENRQIKCHKVVLSACSTYFERLLIQNPCKHPIIFMKDMRFSEMQSLVDFMYKGEVNVSQDDLPSLLKSAEALQIRGLCGTENSNNQESTPTPPSATAPSYPTSCNASVNTSPKHQQDSSNNINSLKSCLQQPQSPNTSSNQSASPSSNGTQRSEKRRREDSPETCKLKQETVEEDGLYYGDMETGQQDEDELLQTGNVPSQQISGNKKQQNLRVKSRSELFKKENEHSSTIKNQSKENKKSLLADRLNQRIKQKQATDYDLFSNHFLGGLLHVNNSENNDLLDEKVFENEDYLKLWLEQNQELEVSMSNSITDNKKVLKKQSTNNDIMSNKSWTNPFANDFFNYDQPELKSKSKKKGEKYASSLKKVTKGVEGVDLLDFVEPGDLDQFLAGKEVSSSGLSRTAVEQAMLGKYNPNRRYSNEAMWAALMDVKKGGSIYRAAQTHKVPRKSLRNWMKRWHIKSSFPMPQQLKQFVENNRKSKMELRKELTNNLLDSLAIDKDNVKIVKEEKMEIDNVGHTDDVDKSFESGEILNLKMDSDRIDYDESQDEAVDLRQEKHNHSIEKDRLIGKDEEQSYKQIIDMSGNILYDENIEVPIKNIDYSFVNNYTQLKTKPKNTEKKIVSFSNVEQLAGIQSEN